MATIKEVITDAITKVAAKFHGEIVDNLASTNSKLPLSAAQGKALKEYVDKIAYPVGSVFTWSSYILTENSIANGTRTTGYTDLSDAAKVANYFGFGTWMLIDSKFLLPSTTDGKFGGASTVTLKTANLPSHSHGISGLKGTANDKELNGELYNMAVQSKDQGISGTGICKADTTKNQVVGYAVNSKNSTATYNDKITIMASHSHSVTINDGTTRNSGSGNSFDIMPPYFNVLMYQRIA